MKTGAVTDDGIQVSLLTGWLGSGKTTLLNHLLQDPDMAETAVLVNEFGEIGRYKRANFNHRWRT